jgi:hypothetical protein
MTYSRHLKFAVWLGLVSLLSAFVLWLAQATCRGPGVLIGG